jgi:NAD(P)-dependent dehydrogenase (short-subunit alcohol dehydrogenase family)
MSARMSTAPRLSGSKAGMPDRPSLPPEAGLANIRKRQLTGELGTPEEVAQAALFLASDESSLVLGSALFVDGGVRGAKV